LSEDADVTRQAITKHLQALVDAGLVHDRRQGRERIWEIEPKRLDDAREYLDLVSAQWNNALNRLRDFVEE
jgi:DNA-binding transcriptional ArsR family regulator